MSKQILVIGDLIVDETYHVQVRRLSPEAPIPTAELLHQAPKKAPGGAGFAAAFSSSIGNNTHLCTIASKDNSSMLWFDHKVNTVSVTNTATNITKTRFIEKESGYHLLRLDNDQIVPAPNVNPESVISILKTFMEGIEVDGCLLADYKKGFFHPSFRWHELIDFLASKEIPTLLDTRMENISHYMKQKTTSDNLWIKLNKVEAEKVRFNLLGEGTWEDNREVISNLVVTTGSEGAIIYEKDREKLEVPVPKEYISNSTPDTTGCGDIFDVTFVTALASGDSAETATSKAVAMASELAWIPFEEKLYAYHGRKTR